MTHESTQLVLDCASNSEASGGLIKPEPRVAINIRKAVPGVPGGAPGSGDFEFIDDLQKKNGKALGFMHRATIESYIASGDIVIAETPPPVDANGSCIPGVRGEPLGYCMGRDKYFKREDVGIMYQLAVTPGSRRSLIGAMLVQAIFAQAAYGCKLYCLWCAQDLEANHFWESIGFVPLAFRTGSCVRGRERIHIFWEKRIREGDSGPGGPGATPYWFPSQTSGGAIGEDRLVIPIPPDTHWSDAKPMVLPGVDRFVDGEEVSDQKSDVSASGAGQLTSDRCPPRKRARRRRREKEPPAPKTLAMGGFRFANAEDPARLNEKGKEKPQKRPRKKRVKRKYHPKYLATARELCARYLEEVHAGRLLPEGDGKYDVSRSLCDRESRKEIGEQESRESFPGAESRLLDAA